MVSLIFQIQGLQWLPGTTLNLSQMRDTSVGIVIDALLGRKIGGGTREFTQERNLTVVKNAESNLAIPPPSGNIAVSMATGHLLARCVEKVLQRGPIWKDMNFFIWTWHFNAFPPGKFFMLFCRLLIFSIFQNQLYQKILSGIPSECQTDWIQIRPTFCHAWSGSNLFAKVMSRGH